MVLNLPKYGHTAIAEVLPVQRLDYDDLMVILKALSPKPSGSTLL
ncbi:MAG: hypothetical protein ACOX62_04900 [Christensenellales bacterium]